MLKKQKTQPPVRESKDTQIAKIELFGSYEVHLKTEGNAPEQPDQPDQTHQPDQQPKQPQKDVPSFLPLNDRINNFFEKIQLSSKKDIFNKSKKRRTTSAISRYSADEGENEFPVV